MVYYLRDKECRFQVIEKLKYNVENVDNFLPDDISESIKTNFVEAMDEDLNTSKALAVLFDLTSKANKDEKDAFTILFKLAGVLGFSFEKAQLSEEELTNAVQKVSEVLGENFASMDELLAFRKKLVKKKIGI